MNLQSHSPISYLNNKILQSLLLLLFTSSLVIGSDLITNRIIVPSGTYIVNESLRPEFEICNINIFDALSNEWHVVVKIVDKNENEVFNEIVQGVFLAKGSSSNPSCVILQTNQNFTPNSTGTHTITVDVNYSEDINTANDMKTEQFSVIEAPKYNISGIVLEEINYGGGLGSFSGTPRPNVIMELYSGSGNFLSSTATIGDGSYSFTELVPGTYTVRAANFSVTSSRPRNGGSEGNPIPVQIYRTDASSGSPTDVKNKVGGEEPRKVDANINTGGVSLSVLASSIMTPQSITMVKLVNKDVGGINFVFNFSTIVNTNSDSQGSLRQFIINSNTLSNNGLAQSGKTAGIESSIFMIPSSTDPLGRPADPNFGGTTFNILPTSELPPITDKAKIDGFIQTALSGDTNPTRPEILLDGSNAGEISTGLSVLLSDCVITGITIQKFGGNGIFCNSKIFLGTVSENGKSVECLNNGFNGIQSKSADYVGDDVLLLKDNGGDGIRIENDLDVDGIRSENNAGWGAFFGDIFYIRRDIGNRAYFWENGLGGISGVNGLLSGSYIDCTNNGLKASGNNSNEGHGIIVKDAVLRGASLADNKGDGINAETIRHTEVDGLEKLIAIDNGGYGIKLKGTMTADGVSIQDNGGWGIHSQSGNIYILKDSKNVRNYVWRNAKGGVSAASGRFQGKFMDFAGNGSGATTGDEGYGLIAKYVTVNGIEVSKSSNDGIKAESIFHTRILGMEELQSISNGGNGLTVEGNITCDGLRVNNNDGWGALSNKGSIKIKLHKTRNFASYNKRGGLSAVNGTVSGRWLFASSNGETAQSSFEGHGITAGRVNVQELGSGHNKGDGIRAHVVTVNRGFSITDNDGFGILGSRVNTSGIKIRRNKKGGIKLVRNVNRSESLAKINSSSMEDNNTVKIENSTISNNDGMGIELGFFDNGLIQNNNISGNTGYDLFSGEKSIKADNNWWGSNASPNSNINDFVSVDNWLADSVSIVILSEKDSFNFAQGRVDTILLSFANILGLHDSLNVVIDDSLDWSEDRSIELGINDSTGGEVVLNISTPNSIENNRITITATSFLTGLQVRKNILVKSYLPIFTHIDILNDSLTVGYGDTINFTAIRKDQNGSETEFLPDWFSSSSLIDNSGMFISDSTDGIVEITAMDNESGISKTTHVYITDEKVDLSELIISPSSITVSSGDIIEFSAIGKNQFGFPMQYPVIWESEGGTIDVNGLFIVGDSSGSYKVTASDSSGSIKAFATINILVGISPSSENIPNEFSLSQNYPNPFNPSTTISYSIVYNSFVDLSVYDNLGRKIITLVSEKKVAGNYNVKFNPDKLSSGVYLYRLKTGNFIRTKKMMFLK